MKTQKTVKVAVIEGTFPELPTPKMYQVGRGEGGSIKVAAVNAVRDLLKQPALRARRITAVKMTMSVGTKIVEIDSALSLSNTTVTPPHSKNLR